MGVVSTQIKTNTKSSTDPEGTTVTKVTETIQKKADGSTTTTIKTAVTKPDGSTSTSTDVKTTQGAAPAKAAGGYSSSSAAKASPVASGDLGAFRREALTAHNTRRAKHGVPALALADDLNDYAQKWADKICKDGKLKHSDCEHPTGRLGENIAYDWSSRPGGADYTGEAVTEQWYSEISKHDFSRDHQPGTGHFTQIVWKGSKEFGIGKAKSSDGKCFCVGSYRPAGNMVGSWAENVFPPK